MPIFTPGRRWQPPYLPFKKETLGLQAIEGLEKGIKGPLFGCRMCGNCLLQETAFICPMECPKGVRNGPCGGSIPDKCYVDQSRPCIWYAIYERSFAMGREGRLMEVMPPLDWEKVGGETWGDVYCRIKELGFVHTTKGLINRAGEVRTVTWESIFRPIRQPAWWQGDDQYHPPAKSEPVSELERRLRSREFVFTAEVAPPLSIKTDKFLKNIDLIKPYVAAINFTDNPSATPRMSSWACSKLAIERGAEPVMQIAARDRTRIGLQSEAIGASALGIRNILCLSGDSMKMAPAPRGRMDIIDFDSIQMLWILRKMRDERKYLDGRELKTPPQYFLGAAASPFASQPKFQALREHKKINAGAQFFQTNLVFDMHGLEEWINEIAKRNILDKVFLLIGIAPLKSLKMAYYMDREVPGVFVPKTLLSRMEKADQKGGSQEEGILIANEIIEKIKNINIVNGIHIMAVGWEEIVPRIITESGIITKDKIVSE